jgi:hypothetical protein
MVLATTLAAFELQATSDPVSEQMGMTMQPQGLRMTLKLHKSATERAPSGLA